MESNNIGKQAIQYKKLFKYGNALARSPIQLKGENCYISTVKLTFNDLVFPFSHSLKPNTPAPHFF